MLCYRAVTQAKQDALPAASQECIKRLRDQLNAFAYQCFILAARGVGGDANIFRRELQDVDLDQEALLRAWVQHLVEVASP